jgi:hypothetical protein
MTITTSPRMMTAQPSDNIIVEDVAILFMVNGITITQISDTYEWGHSMLLNMASSIDTSRRMEAMQALVNAQPGTSQNKQDRPQPLELRWWYLPQWTERTAVMLPNTQ